MNHPIRVAERAAALDIISDGRLEFGTARSSTWTELGGFGVDPDDTKKTWDEFVRVLPRMWADEPFAYDGVCFSMPERNVLPKPVQKPHPPMWVTVTSPGTELDAAERGLGCLGVASTTYAEQERRTRRVPPADPELRSGQFGGQRSGDDAQLPVLPRGRRPGRGHRHAHGRPVRADQLPSAVDPGGLPDPGLPVARQPGSGRRLATARSRAILAASRRASASATPIGSCRVIQRWEAIGVDGHQLPGQHLRDHPAGRGIWPACGCSPPR